MATQEDLRRETKSFMNKHWVLEELGASPEWNDPWFFVGSIPGGNTQGCYVLFQNEQVIYVGVGGSRGSGIYEGYGLGARLSSYIRRIYDSSTTSQEQWRYEPTGEWKEREITSIRTISFSDQNGAGYPYLAYALEVFLISRLDGLVNKTHHRAP